MGFTYSPAITKTYQKEIVREMMSTMLFLIEIYAFTITFYFKINLITLFDASIHDALSNFLLKVCKVYHKITK